MKSFGNFIIVFFLALLIPISENIGQELNYEFVQKENYYSYTANLFIAADPDCLIDLIYNFENISKYSSGAKSIELVQHHESGYDVTFIYQKLIFIENESTWRRTLSPDKRKIAFEMLPNETNISWVPQIIYSSGYYQITSIENGSLVEYYQECELEHGALQDMYIRKAKKEAIQFLNTFEHFLSNNCDKIEPEKFIYLNGNP